jgi:hypothetical protein
MAESSKAVHASAVICQPESSAHNKYIAGRLVNEFFLRVYYRRIIFHVCSYRDISIR